MHSSRSQVPWPSFQKYLVCPVICLSIGDGGPVMLLLSNKLSVFIKSGLHFHFYFFAICVLGLSPPGQTGKGAERGTGHCGHMTNYIQM